MKIERIIKPPEPLVFRVGSESFALQLKAFTGDDRMRVFDAVACDSFALIAEEVESVVTGWTGVEDDSGEIPFEMEEPIIGVDGKKRIDAETGDVVTQKKKQLGLLLGQVPARVQVEIMIAVLTVLDLPHVRLLNFIEHADAFTQVLIERGRKTAAPETIDTRPTSPSASDGSKDASVVP